MPRRWPKNLAAQGGWRRGGGHTVIYMLAGLFITLVVVFAALLELERRAVREINERNRERDERHAKRVAARRS